MTDLYRAPESREETLSAELVLVVPVTEPVYRIDKTLYSPNSKGREWQMMIAELVSFGVLRRIGTDDV